MNSIRVCNVHHVHYFSFTRKSYCLCNEFLNMDVNEIIAPFLPSLKGKKITLKKKKKKKKHKKKKKKVYVYTLSKLESLSMLLSPSINLVLSTKGLFC